MPAPKIDTQQPLYARLASRFARLALGASEEHDDEDDKDKDKNARADEEERDRKAREEGDAEEDENDKNCSEEEREARKSRNAKRRSKAKVADDDGDSTDAKAEARGRAAERERWETVLASREAEGRAALACSLLADTDMSPERICSALLASPTEARHGLAARMSHVPRPDLGSPPPAGARPDATTSSGKAAGIVAAYKKASGG